MKWDSVQLGEVMDVKHGFAFKGEFFADSGEYMLLTPGNCHETGGLKLRGERDKFYSGEFPPEFLLSEGDMLVVMTDLVNSAPILGGSLSIPESNRFLHNQRLGLVEITDLARIDRTYLRYLLNTHDYRAQVRGSASGATVRHTSPGRIKACRVLIPRDLEQQRRIGETLSAYESLIENNRRRMALLEDAARQLYREWFVRLRFPGHEHTRITDGVPEGWDQERLGESIEIRKGRNITQAIAEQGAVPVVAGGLEPAYFHSTANARGPVITISASGANAGYVNLYSGDIWASDCSYISAAWTDDIYYLYCLLKHRQQEVFALQKGAAQPHVYPKDLQRLDVVSPPGRLLRHFAETVEPVFALIANLSMQNRKAQATRDLLLPRLISGEIAV